MRSGTVQGRGDALYPAWKLADAPKDLPLTKAGMVSADMFWERITYFLDRVVPVANETPSTISNVASVPPTVVNIFFIFIQFPPQPNKSSSCPQPS